MCGVAGIYAYHPDAPPVERTALRRIRDAMVSRGPDGAGEWIAPDQRVGLAHRRLSIIDLSQRAAQPMASDDGVRVVSFNGEIYNYRVLRQTLQRQGRTFKSESDTEVLLQLYAQRGPGMLDSLRGMYAFALWDGAEQCLWLARDPYGIKPLYYADDGKQLWIASQVKALLAGGMDDVVDPAGLAGFLVFGSVPEPYTTQQRIRAVPAGSLIRVDHRGARPPQRFFSIAATFAQAAMTPEPLPQATIGQRVREALLDSVAHHLVADVPVGVFLSAGIDSGALTGLMADCGQQEIRTVTLAFEEFRGQHRDESLLAEQVARHYGTEHYTRVVSELEFREDLPQIMAAMDQPSIDGINTWFVSKAAREAGLKVAISGLGGDELFGGYPAFQDIPRWVRWLALPSRLPQADRLGRIGYRLLAQLCPGLHPKGAGLLGLGGSYPGAYLLRRGLFMPWEIKDLDAPELLRQGLSELQELDLIGSTLQPDPGTAYARVATLEASLYMRNQLLRDSDWASMAHSLEVRVPLVDADLLKRLAPTLVANEPLDGKRLLAAGPTKALPVAVSERAKSGFETPVANWLERMTPCEWKTSPRQHPMPWARRWAMAALNAQNPGLLGTPAMGGR